MGYLFRAPGSTGCLLMSLPNALLCLKCYLAINVQLTFYCKKNLIACFLHQKREWLGQLFRGNRKVCLTLRWLNIVSKRKHKSINSKNLSLKIQQVILLRVFYSSFSQVTPEKLWNKKPLLRWNAVILLGQFQKKNKHYGCSSWDSKIKPPKRFNATRSAGTRSMGEPPL